MTPKKGMTTNFFPPLSFIAVFGSRIRDPGSGMGKNQDPGSGINIPDPQHWFSITMSDFWFPFYIVWMTQYSTARLLPKVYTKGCSLALRVRRSSLGCGLAHRVRCSSVGNVSAYWKAGKSSSLGSALLEVPRAELTSYEDTRRRASANGEGWMKVWL